VDVSFYQGSIDWKQVKKAGVTFAILRIGYRGYSNGTLCRDSKFDEYYKGAKAAGIKVGAYIFSQAINRKEAREEANFCLKILNGRKLDYPIMYDPESILYAKARTDNVTGEQFTKNTKTFCRTIDEAGYEFGVYANLKWQAYKLEMHKIKDIPMWYADYEKKPQTPYAFTYWQYSSQASIPGISGRCDINIEMVPA
nr:glycoside hydrolase family 25 protein [Lachnospiraceae bacterium]